MRSRPDGRSAIAMRPRRVRDGAADRGSCGPCAGNGPDMRAYLVVRRAVLRRPGSDAIVGHVGVVESVRAFGALRLARRFPPVVAGERRKRRVAREIAVDLGQVEPGRMRQRGTIELAAADAERRRRQAHEREGVGERGGDFGARGGIVALPRDDDVLPLGQRVRQRLPGLAPHDHRMAGGQRAEALQVVRRGATAAGSCADHAVGGDRRDQHDAGRRRAPGRAVSRGVLCRAASALRGGVS